MTALVLVNGVGRAAHVLVAACRDRRLIVLFEAGGEGLRDAAFARRELTVMRWVWSPADGHCCPGKEAEERYRWARNGRFVRARRAERLAPK